MAILSYADLARVLHLKRFRFLRLDDTQLSAIKDSPMVKRSSRLLQGLAYSTLESLEIEITSCNIHWVLLQTILAHLNPRVRLILELDWQGKKCANLVQGLRLLLPHVNHFASVSVEVLDLDPKESLDLTDLGLYRYRAVKTFNIARSEKLHGIKDSVNMFSLWKVFRDLRSISIDRRTWSSLLHFEAWPLRLEDVSLSDLYLDDENSTEALADFVRYSKVGRLYLAYSAGEDRWEDILYNLFKRGSSIHALGLKRVSGRKQLGDLFLSAVKGSQNGEIKHLKLEANHHVALLDLSVARALGVCQLVQLDLNSCRMSPRSIKDMLLALAATTPLQHLTLGVDCTDIQGSKKLDEMLVSSTLFSRLRSFHLQGHECIDPRAQGCATPVCVHFSNHANVVEHFFRSKSLVDIDLSLDEHTEDTLESIELLKAVASLNFYGSRKENAPLLVLLARNNLGVLNFHLREYPHLCKRHADA